MRNAEIDAQILACCGLRWRKVAYVIAKVTQDSGLDEKAWGYDTVAKRLRVLVRKHELHAAGNIWKWRRSEVRLPTGGMNAAAPQQRSVL